MLPLGCWTSCALNFIGIIFNEIKFVLRKILYNGNKHPKKRTFIFLIYGWVEMNLLKTIVSVIRK